MKTYVAGKPVVEAWRRCGDAVAQNAACADGRHIGVEGIEAIVVLGGTMRLRSSVEGVSRVHSSCPKKRLQQIALQINFSFR
jgi:hypothetical protein